MNIGEMVIGLIGLTEDSTNAYIVRLVIIASNIIFWLLIAFILNRVSKTVIFRALRVEKKGARALTVAKLLNSVVKYVVWFIVTMVILSNLGVDLTPFIASAGVIGFAIGFGAQQIVSDFLSGFFIIFEGEFIVGDIIEINGFKGTVLSIGLRDTVVENWKGERLIINNGGIGSIINFSKIENGKRDYKFEETDLQKLQDIMPAFLEQIDQAYELIIEPPQFLGVIELANSSINMRLIAKTETMKHFQIERDIRRDLVQYFDKHDITIPFPQVVVHNA